MEFYLLGIIILILGCYFIYQYLIEIFNNEIPYKDLTNTQVWNLVSSGKHMTDLNTDNIIGINNEKISYKNGILYINGEKIVEKNVIHNNKINVSIILGVNEYFVMSDNRENYNFNCDSINRGPVKVDHVIGKVII